MASTKLASGIVRPWSLKSVSIVSSFFFFLAACDRAHLSCAYAGHLRRKWSTSSLLFPQAGHCGLSTSLNLYRYQASWIFGDSSFDPIRTCQCLYFDAGRVHAYALSHIITPPKLASNLMTSTVGLINEFWSLGPGSEFAHHPGHIISS